MNALLVPVRRVEERNIELSTEQDPQHLIQRSSTLSTINTTITQPQLQLGTSRNYAMILLRHLIMTQVLLLPYLNNQLPLMGPTFKVS